MEEVGPSYVVPISSSRQTEKANSKVTLPINHTKGLGPKLPNPGINSPPSIPLAEFPKSQMSSDCQTISDNRIPLTLEQSSTSHVCPPIISMVAFHSTSLDIIPRANVFQPTLSPVLDSGFTSTKSGDVISEPKFLSPIPSPDILNLGPDYSVTLKDSRLPLSPTCPNAYLQTEGARSIISSTSAPDHVNVGSAYSVTFLKYSRLPLSPSCNNP